MEARLPAELPADWRALAAQLAVKLAAAPVATPLVIGLSGGQGAGKSTLARALVLALEQCQLRAASLSLDDVYLTRAARAQLATTAHPLLRTRGVPGTHDMALLSAVLDSLGDSHLALPAFNKATDDRVPESQWPRVSGPLQVLVLEGWCLGATPQPEAALAAPVNVLERNEDSDGRYRRYVNQALAEQYVPVWSRLQSWLFLAVPDLDAVRRWRGEQEQALAAGQRMSPAQLQRFIHHYERLTLWLLQTAPDQATWTLRLGADHRLQL